jgi:hypothetical protein
MIASVLTPVLALTLSDIVDKAILFVTVAAFGALFLVYGTTKTLRDTNGDLRAQHEDDKARLHEAQSENADLRKEMTAMAGRISVLEGLVTGAVNWTAISDQLEAHHAEALNHWKQAIAQWAKDESVLVEIRDELHDLNEHCDPRDST